MKIAYITDTHFRDNTPASRTDGDIFLDIQIIKLTSVLDICKKKNVDVLIHGGDFFDIPRPSNFLIYSIMSIIKKYNIKILVNIGSHDMYGYNSDVLNRTALGILHNSGFIYLSDDIKCFDKLSISFIKASKNINLKAYKCNSDIIVSHDPIVKDKAIFEHILIKDVAKTTKSKYILCGHIHTQFMEKENDITLINPGCLVRQNIEEKNILPRMYVIDLNTDKIEKVDIESNRNVFKERKIDKKVDFNEFVNSIKTVNFESKNIRKEFDIYSKLQKLDKNVYNDIARRLDEELIGT